MIFHCSRGGPPIFTSAVRGPQVRSQSHRSLKQSRERADLTALYHKQFLQFESKYEKPEVREEFSYEETMMVPGAWAVMGRFRCGPHPLATRRTRHGPAMLLQHHSKQLARPAAWSLLKASRCNTDETVASRYALRNRLLEFEPDWSPIRRIHMMQVLLDSVSELENSVPLMTSPMVVSR
jgi:hypothetical protein